MPVQGGRGIMEQLQRQPTRDFRKGKGVKRGAGVRVQFRDNNNALSEDERIGDASEERRCFFVFPSRGGK